MINNRFNVVYHLLIHTCFKTITLKNSITDMIQFKEEKTHSKNQLKISKRIFKKRIGILACAVCLFVTSCKQPTVKSVEIQKMTIVSVWKVPAVSVHDKISPRYEARLSNGDTVPVSAMASIGDTICYQIITLDSCTKK